MNDTAFIFFTIAITTALIYFMYKIMLGTNSDKGKDEELQITAAELIEQLLILQKQKKHDIVQNLAKSYLEKKKSNDDVRKVYAKSLFESKKTNDAITQSKIILKKNPKDIDIRILLASCYVSEQNTQEAISVLLDTLNFDPENITTIKNLSKIYCSNNQKISALKMFKRLDPLLESINEKIKNKIKIAELQVELLELKDAIESYKEVLETYPDDIQIKKNLVDLYIRTSDEEALEDAANEIVRTAIDGSDSLWALNVLMNYFRDKENYEKALQYANQINEHPLSNKSESSENIANIFLVTNEVDQCIEILKSLIDEDAGNINAKKSLAKAYEAKKDFDRAISVYKNLLDESEPRQMSQIHIELSDLYANWAMYLFQNEDNEGCFKQFTIALKYYNQNPDIYYKLGNVNKFIKNFNEAISQYKKAIELDPTKAEYYYELAECYEAIDSIYEQKKCLLDSLKYGISNPKVHYKLGLIYHFQGDMTSAISNLQKAVELDNSYVDAMFKLALLYENTGRKDDAIIVYEDILNINPNNEAVINSLKMLCE